MIRIFGVPWHVAHNFALLQIPDTHWYLLENGVRKWNNDVRPLPENVTFVPYYESNKYDLAVLHIDQQCIEPESGKSRLFRELNTIIDDIPKIIINHGTPFYMERWNGSGEDSWAMPAELNDAPIDEQLEYQRKFLINGGMTKLRGRQVKIKGIKELIGNATMVVNSFQASKQWGWGEPIWHGISEDGWENNAKELRSFTTLSPVGLDYYYNRQLYNATHAKLLMYGLEHMYIGKNYSIQKHRSLADIGGFNAYKDIISRQLLYFNHTREAPMPRSRTEAMLSGACILTTEGQDVDMFINGRIDRLWSRSLGLEKYLGMVDDYIETNKRDLTGFIVPTDPVACAGIIYHLLNNHYQNCKKIGEQGKEIAEHLFSKSNYDKQWLKLIERTVR